MDDLSPNVYSGWNETVNVPEMKYRALKTKLFVDRPRNIKVAGAGWEHRRQDRGFEWGGTRKSQLTKNVRVTGLIPCQTGDLARRSTNEIILA